VWEAICDVIGKRNGRPTRATPTRPPPARLKHIFGAVEAWTMTKTKFEAMEILDKYDIPATDPVDERVGEDQSLRATAQWWRSIIRPRQVPDSRQPDQTVEPCVRGEALTSARRTHRGNPARGARFEGATLAEYLASPG